MLKRILLERRVMKNGGKKEKIEKIEKLKKMLLKKEMLGTQDVEKMIEKIERIECVDVFVMYSVKIWCDGVNMAAGGKMATDGGKYPCVETVTDWWNW